MARHREFCEAQALDAAIECFWRDGYEATSVRDLAAQMGIAGTSLYNAFDDKRSLFRRALERYLDETLRRRIATLENELPPKEAVRRFLIGSVERSLDDAERRGCFLVNSALEVAPHDELLGAYIGERLGEIEDFFARAVAKAQAMGTIPAERDAGDLARLLLGVTLGIRVLARARPDRDLLEGLLRSTLALLDPPPSTNGGPTP
jgi:TetR/AcrR family transcriptional regulator, transcriptional repressor for nem operon